MSYSRKGVNNPNYDVKGSEELKEKIKLTRLKRLKLNNNSKLVKITDTIKKISTIYPSICDLYSSKRNKLFIRSF